MEPDTPATASDTPTLLSTLWIFVLLTTLFRDVHELFRPGFLDEVLTGVVNGTAMTEPLLLGAGIMVEAQVAMVVLARVLPRRANRWANVVVGLLALIATAAITGSSGPDLDDVFFATVTIAALLVIVWRAWTWRPVVPSADTVDRPAVGAVGR
jgi:hypothetical protein